MSEPGERNVAAAEPSARRDDWFTALFLSGMGAISATYVVLIVAMLVAMAAFTSVDTLLARLASPEIRYATRLSIISCTLTALLSLWVAVPTGYLMSRFRTVGSPSADRVLGWVRSTVDVILDIPIVLPPLVIGLALLILFQTAPGRAFERYFFPVTFAVPSVVLAQFMVACAFAVRTMRVTFDQIDPRSEQVALTLGCSRSQAFWMVVLPEARRGMFTAGTLAWARSLGEFGPILIFSGATRMRTEVLSTSVFLEMSVGDIRAAVAVSLIMIAASALVLVAARLVGMRQPLV